MNKNLSAIYLVFTLGLLLFSSSCKAQVNTLSPEEFQSQLNANKDIYIVDVRTPEEYEGGYIRGAKNIDWNGNDFEKKVNELDKTKNIYTYCLSGGRSGNAAKKLQDLGFEKVYNLDGGMMAWRAKNLPEVKPNHHSVAGMSLADYEKLYKGKSKKILVDFYADWCIPCAKMKPFLKRMGDKMANEVEIIRINAEQNQELCQSLGISGLPHLIIYVDDQVEWKRTGFASEAELTRLLKK